MKLLKEKLRAAKAELRIRQRELNAAKRGYERALRLVGHTENQIDRHMARAKPKTK